MAQNLWILLLQKVVEATDTLRLKKKKKTQTSLSRFKQVDPDIKGVRVMAYSSTSPLQNMSKYDLLLALLGTKYCTTYTNQ